MVRDPNLTYAARALDNNWYYDGHIELPATGFNPARGAILSAKISAYSKWSKRKSDSARKFNFEDNLMHEVLFSIHDYLHIWAYQTINSARPELEFGFGEINQENFEDFVYLHLLTETVATIGLDYWYLSNIDLNDVVPVGTKKNNLAANYTKQQLPEFRRFNPSFNPYDVSFFDFLENLYCYSTVKGFTGTALERSPTLLAWMKHEYKYAETQRRLTRLWLSSFRTDLKLSVEDDLERPLKKSKTPWRTELSQHVKNLLWKKMTQKKDIFINPSKKAPCWEAKGNFDDVDFRFTNLNFFGDDYWQIAQAKPRPKEQEQYMFSQIVSKYQLELIDPDDVELLLKMKAPLDLQSMRAVLRNYSPISISRPEPRSIFVAG